MSRKTHEMHEALIRVSLCLLETPSLQVLTLQMLLPTLFAISMLSYVLSQLDIVHLPILEHLTIGVSYFCSAAFPKYFEMFGVIPLFEPLITLRYVRPYAE